MKTNKFLLFIVLMLITASSALAATYCSGEYNTTDGDWIVDSLVSCSDENISINGSLIVEGDVEEATTQFRDSGIANWIYDITANEQTIPSSSPTWDAPTSGTGDFDASDNSEFYIAANISENKIQFLLRIFNDSNLYGVDIDNEADSGFADLNGADIAFGSAPLYGLEGVLVYNSSIDCGFIEPGCMGWFQNVNNATSVNSSWDPLLGVNYTIYFLNSSDNLNYSVVIDAQGDWEDKEIAYSGLGPGNTFYNTLFKNSSAVVDYGVLNLDNVTLNIDYNITIDGGNLSAENSEILFWEGTNFGQEAPDDGVSNFHFEKGDLYLENVLLTSENSKHWGMNVESKNYYMDYCNISYNGYNGTDSYWNSYSSSYGGTIKNSYITNCNNGTGGESCFEFSGNAQNLLFYNNTVYNPGAKDIYFEDGSDGANKNISYNTFLSFVDFEGADGLYVSYNEFSEKVLYSHQDGRTITEITFLNNFFNDGIENHNSTTLTTMEFSDAYGAVQWSGTGNYTTYEPFGLTEKIIINPNNITVNIDAGFENYNRTARIYFEGLSYATTPYLLRDGVRCDDGPTCTISNYDNVTGQLVATVSHFSTYTTSEGDAPTPTPTDTDYGEAFITGLTVFATFSAIVVLALVGALVVNLFVRKNEDPEMVKKLMKAAVIVTLTASIVLVGGAIVAGIAAVI